MLISLSDQKCNFSESVSEKYMQNAYALYGCSSTYSREDMEEKKLQLFLKETNCDCSTFLNNEGDPELITNIPITSEGCGGGNCKVIIQNVYNKYTYTHHQTVASTTWTIPHELGYIPGEPLITDSNQNQISGVIVSETTMETIIQFSSPVSGFAYLS